MKCTNNRTNNRLLEEGSVNFCYSDESGTGEEPIATMVGIVVDAGRMHLTKGDWVDLLGILSHLTNRTIAKLHTRRLLQWQWGVEGCGWAGSRHRHY